MRAMSACVGVVAVFYVMGEKRYGHKRSIWKKKEKERGMGKERGKGRRKGKERKPGGEEEREEDSSVH